MPQLKRTWSAPCTSAENLAAHQRLQTAAIPLRFWNWNSGDSEEEPHVNVGRGETASSRNAKVVPQRWLDALALAEEVAKAELFTGCPAGRNRRTKEQPPEEDIGSPLGKFRAEFLRTQGEKVRAALSSVWGPKVELKPIPLAPDVAQRFIKATQCVKDAELLATLHGTDIANHRSIFQRGLLIPRGAGNGVDVKHGLCHGAGIYSAALTNARLAAGFCNAPQMLVCGIVDDTVAVPPRRCGNFAIFRESATMRYVGDAIVTFDPSRIAPLFTASAPGAPSGSFGSTVAPRNHHTVT